MHCGTCVTQTGKSKHNTVSQAGAKSNGVLKRRARFHGCAVRHARDGMERLRNRCLDGKLSNAACRLLLGTGGAMPHHCQRICESVCQRLLRGLFVRLLGLLPCRLVGVRAAPHERHHGREDQHAASHIYISGAVVGVFFSASCLQQRLGSAHAQPALFILTRRGHRLLLLRGLAPV